jgi:hypothetical protein
LGGDDSFEKLIPEQLKEVFSPSSIDFRIDFDPEKQTIPLLSMGVKLSTQLVVVKDKFSIEDIYASLTTHDLTESDKIRSYGRVGSTLKVTDAHIKLEAGLPDFYLIGCLADNESINLSRLFSSYTPEYQGNFEEAELSDIVLSDFSIRLDVPNHSFWLYARSYMHWEIIPDMFVLESVQVDLRLGETEKNCEISGGFLIDTSHVFLSVQVGDEMIFKGTADEIQLGKLVEYLAETLKISSFVPNFIKESTLKDISVSYDTQRKHFLYSGNLETNIANKLVTFKLDIDISSSVEGFSNHYGGELRIGETVFKLSFDQTDSTELVQGKWEQLNNETLGINTLVEELGLHKLSIPSSMDLALVAASFKYDIKNETIIFEAESKNYGKANFVAFKTGRNWEYFSGFAMKAEAEPKINLSKIPLINQVFSKDQTLALEQIHIVLSSTDIVKKKGDKYNDEIKQLIGDGLNAGVKISMNLNLAGYNIPLSIETGSDQEALQEQLVKKSDPVILSALPVSSPVLASSKETEDPAKSLSSDGTLWYDIQKKFGPVIIEKIGVKYKEGVLFCVLRTSLKTSGLQLDLINVSVGTKLDEFNPVFSIDGIGMGYKNASFNIEGTFLEVSKGSMNFAGGAVFKSKAFSLTAYGSYEEFKSEDNKDVTSMFVFAQINRRFGGPPCFFVTGILGGFGYNSKLRIPDLEDVHKLPLISGLKDTAKIGGDQATPTDALEKLIKPSGSEAPWITPKAGNIWMAAGIQFSTYELIQSTALLVGEFGQDFSVAVLGTSTGKFPKKGKTTYAFMELDLRAYFNPNEGEISFSSIVSASSYVLDQGCHITGGFAMFFWFGNNKHAGDFVITMGGYSPYFRAPAWYPKIPRLGINWRVDSHVTIKGGGYFAITPSAAMAGGSIELLFKAGNLRAWVKGNADIILWWNPFYFIIDFGVSVGASYTMKIFGSNKTFSVELGCKLSLWGPATGGKVKVNWFIISFTISFGAKIGKDKDTLPWTEFKEVLPEAENLVKVMPIEGLLPATVAPDQIEKTTDGELLVRPNKFEFTTSSKIPCTNLYLGKNKKNPFKKNNKLNIRPMRQIDMESYQQLYIEKEDASGTWKEVDMESASLKTNTAESRDWSIEPNTENVANSLWGKGDPKKLSKGDDQLIMNQYIGFKITAPLPVVKLGPGVIDVEKNLSYSDIPKRGENPILQNSKPFGLIPKEDNKVLEKISEIESNKGQRNELHDMLKALGLEELENESLSILSESTEKYFINTPLVVT